MSTENSINLHYVQMNIGAPAREILLTTKKPQKASTIFKKMDIGTRNILFNVIDTYFQNFNTKKAFAKS